MTNYPNPWDFSNFDPNMYSFDKRYKIEFGELLEIAMGAPIGGECYVIEESKKTLLSKFSGGPVIWECDNYRVALPVWTRNLHNRTVQQIAIADLNNMTLTVYKETFRVLDLHSFKGGIICGLDSPVYMTKTLNLDIAKLKIEKTEKL